MTTLVVLTLMYFFFVTPLGKEWFGIGVKTILFYGILLLNPVSLVFFLGIYCVIKGITG